MGNKTIINLKKNIKNKPTSNLSQETNTKKPSFKSSQVKNSYMKKIFLILIPLIIIICLIGFFLLGSNANTVKAQLIIESGTVEVKHSGGTWTSAENGMDLFQSDSLKTGENTSASIILFESSVIRLDSNTEVTLEKIIKQTGETNVKIIQDAGRTWNTISKISGIDNYDVQTPTTVASVRGTAFVVIVQSNGTTYYGVAHGTLNVSSISNGIIQDEIDVSGNESVVVHVNLISETLSVNTFEADEWVQENLQNDEQLMEDVKEELYIRIDPYIPELKSRYGMTDEELNDLIDGYLLGYIDLPDNTPDWIREIIELS